MKLFVCSFCSNVVYFDNKICQRCQKQLGYFSDTNTMHALEPSGGLWLSLGEINEFRFCANAAHDACNWLIPAGSPERFCATCRHNQTIPDLSIDENLRRWRKFEVAKHHLFYGLLRLRLPVETRLENPRSGLAFEVLVDDPAITGGVVLTGHQDGVITLNLAEADDAVRERRRTELSEPYRTLLGHFRHEIGHYYWDRLINDGGPLDDFRALFGDESQSYAAALQKYYADGPPADWRDNYVSAYASAHPWEDFAETWAHFLHIVDTLEMAGSFGLKVDPIETEDAAYHAEANFEPHAAINIDELIRRWLPIAGAVNNINRCMGQPDLYPFVLTPAVIRKLGFVHQLIAGPRFHPAKPPENRPEPEPLTTVHVMPVSDV